jgi:hypothetical protein
MRIVSALALCIAAASLTGCAGFNASAPSAVTTSKLPAIGGTVYGGQQPIGFGTIQLWQVGTGGYGTGATPLIPTLNSSNGYYAGGASGCVASSSQTCYANVVTSATGSFNISGDYTCTTGSELYLTSTGGQATPGQNNSAIALMLGFGTCGAGNGSAKITMNEAVTVASVYALQAFLPATPATTPWTVGTGSGNQAGLVNAFNDIPTLAKFSDGTAQSSTSTVTLPTFTINALANSLASCINSPSSTSPGCTALFQQTPNADNSLPTDTISAALNIVRNPQRNVAAILGLAVPGSPFQPATTSATDLTLAVTYTGSGIASPAALAIDPTGNVWVANTGSSAATSSVTELSHTGTALSGANGYQTGGINLPTAIAIDTNGNAWIANGNSTLSEIGSSGNAVGTSPFTGGGLSTPTSVAIDGTGNVWLSNTGNTVSEFSPAGAPLSGTGFTPAGISAPVGIAINPH